VPDAGAGTCDLIKDTVQCVCHGARGANCNQIPVNGLGVLERTICRAAPAVHLKASDPVLSCARNDLPPRVILADEPATTPVESFTRLNDLLTGVVVDRNRDGVSDGTLSSMPACIKDGTTSDCRLLAVCLDVDVWTQISLEEQGGVPTLSYAIGAPIIEPHPAGAVCEGQVDFRYAADSGATSGALGTDPVQAGLESKVATFIPGESFGEIQLDGLVSLVNPRLVALKTSADAGRCNENLTLPCTKASDCAVRCVALDDYVGVTADYEVPPAAGPRPSGTQPPALAAEPDASPASATPTAAEVSAPTPARTSAPVTRTPATVHNKRTPGGGS